MDQIVNEVAVAQETTNSVSDIKTVQEKVHLSYRILHAFDRLTPLSRNSLGAKLLDRFGCADEILRSWRDDSLILAMLRWRKKVRLFGRMKTAFGSAVENSRVLQLILRILNYFYNLPIVCFGIMLFVAGLTVSFSTAVSGYMQGMKNIFSLAFLDYPMVIPGIIIFLISIPLLIFDSRSLANLVCESRFGNQFLCGFLGFDPVCLQRPPHKGHIGGRTFILSMLIGLLAGFSTLYFGVWAIPSTVLLVLTVTVVMTSPEAGFMLIAAFLPLLRHVDLYALVLLLLISFFVKVLRGKRSLHFALVDWAFLLMAVIVFLNCVVFTSSGSFATLVIVLCLIAPMASHLLQSHGVIMRFQKGLLFSSLVTVLAIVLNYLLGFFAHYTLRELPFEGFSQYVIGNFDSVAGAGLYLLMVFPFVLAKGRLSHSLYDRVRYLLYAVLILGGLFLTGSRTIALCGILVLIVYMILRTPRHLLTVFFLLLVAVPSFFFLLPDRFVDMTLDKFASSGANILAGISEFAEQFVESVERFFTGAGFAGATGSSLYTILLSSLGIVGLIAFLILMLLLLGYAYVSVTRARSACPRLMPMMTACRAALCGVLLASLRLPILDNPIVLLAFCLFCGYTMGIGRTMRRATVLAEAISDEDIEFSPIYSKGGGQYE